MANFLIGASIALIALGVGMAYDIIKTWRLRSDLNFERFSDAYLDAACIRRDARQASERA